MSTPSRAITPISHVEDVIKLCIKYGIVSAEVDGIKLHLPVAEKPAQAQGYPQFDEPTPERKSINAALAKLPANYRNPNLWPGGMPGTDID